MQVCVLGSGSGGNCTLVSTSRTRILVDVGFGPRSLERRMRDADLDSRPVDAILVTHGHGDHCRGIPQFLRRHSAPVLMNEGTRQEVAELRKVEAWEPISTGRPVRVGDIDVEAFGVSHDAAAPVGFTLRSNGFKGAVATDLGEISEDVASHFDECNWLVLESNHDENLLKYGPYPWRLKQRVMSRRGHLSNSALARFLTHRLDGNCRDIFLAHLSRQNNQPGIALRSARNALLERGHALFEQCRLHLTDQLKPSIVLSL